MLKGEEGWECYVERVRRRVLLMVILHSGGEMGVGRGNEGLTGVSDGGVSGVREAAGAVLCCGGEEHKCC